MVATLATVGIVAATTSTIGANILTDGTLGAGATTLSSLTVSGDTSLVTASSTGAVKFPSISSDSLSIIL
ncbi:MAG: hypothetical protein Q8O93_03220, partial [bacterium]|nr:hypothetical protein [bacterium]